MRKSKHSTLYQIAESQQGIFTALQATAAGFTGRSHAYHVKEGNWENEQRGIYRLSHFPYEPESQYVVWYLWSCNRQGEPQGVYSHETALSIYELSDLNPAKLHMTVPTNFRRKLPTPDIIKLRNGNLKPDDWQQIGGYKVTTPTRTLHDIIFDTTISREFVCQAIDEGLERGMYPQRELKKYKIQELIKEIPKKYAY